MALNEVQVKAMELIQQDPEAFRVLQEQLHRIDPEGKTIPKSALPDIQLKEKIEAEIKPWKEKTEALHEQLRKKEELDEHQSQREFMRRHYKMNDTQIDELAKWMKEDADGNIYKSYEAAHKYRLALMQPIIPNSTSSPNRVNPMTGHGVREEPWREDIAKRRRESANPRQADRAKAKEAWSKTISELRNRGS